MKNSSSKIKAIPLTDREKIEFEELNRWLHTLNNIVWTVTSVLLSINVIAFKPVIEISYKNPRLGIAISIVFVVQWVCTIVFVVRLLRLSFDIVARIYNLNHYWKDFLESIVAPDIENGIRIKPSTITTMKTPYGKLILPISCLLLLGWSILLVNFTFCIYSEPFIPMCFLR